MSFEIIAPYTLQIEFDDGVSQIIDFEPILAGELYGPLRDSTVFNRVEINSEVQTLVQVSRVIDKRQKLQARGTHSCMINEKPLQ